MCLLCNVIGVKEINRRPGAPKLKDWIDDEENEIRQPIQNRIKKNITYYLGNAIETASIRKAAETLFKRDYEGKKQIFVPEVFLTKDPSLIFHEKQELEKLLAARETDDTINDKMKEKWRCKMKTIEGEVLEKNVYDTLNKYFLSHPEQEVLVLHGHEILDLDAPENPKKPISHWEKDFIIINVTYGYVLNIEAKQTLNRKSMESAKKQLENTKQIIEKWFGADLKPGWVFISAVYCEKGDVWNNCCKDCDMNFVFSGTEDLVMKIEKINKDRKSDSRSD